MPVPKNRCIPPMLALLTMLACLGLTLPGTRPAFAQGTSFGKVERERPKDMQEWASLFHQNISRQIKIAQNGLSKAEVVQPLTTVVKITVNPDGRSSNAVMDASGLSPDVQRHIIRLIRNTKPQPPFTPDMPRQPMDFNLPVNIKP